MPLTEMRRQYNLARLLEDAVDADPIKQFGIWMNDALAADLREPYAMTLATATPTGLPSARIVLRRFDDNGFVFFTSYEGRKAQELAENPHAALLFYWAELERQVRIEGRVERTTAQESDDYFNSRPGESRLAACAAQQSAVIADRESLEQSWRELQARYPNGDIPRPPTWGGYRVIPHTIEFWQGGPYRLHDRLRFRRNDAGGWVRERLAP